MSVREYVVTLHNHEDLESFYEDMETPGGNLYIPEREVSIANRRPVSRSTHYFLTNEEAELVKNDPRVLGVELSLEEQGIELRPSWTQTSLYWNKSNTVAYLYLNWGLLRTVEGVQRLNWGSDNVGNVSGSVQVNSSGKNVDVVIVDGHINPLHPEFAVNSDGSGGSRVIQYNWFELNPQVTGGSASTYVYTPYVSGTSQLTTDNDHGCHVASTACGNTLGWARDSNIYNISPYSSSPSYTSYFIDYIRQWHKNKSINSITKVKNPTITNHSYGASYSTDITNITSITYRGVTYSSPFSSQQLWDWGIPNNGLTVFCSLRVLFIEQDFIDAINEGIIVVGAAGNSYSIIDNYSAVGSDDYNNYFTVTSVGNIYYRRGTVSAAQGVICVGAIDTTQTEKKVDFSNCGPRVDIYAPGTLIMGGVNSNVSVTVQDGRNTSYYQTKKSGTSMASPQVAGLLACLAESWPTMKQSQALAHIVNNSKQGQISEGSGTPPSNLNGLQGSPNRYLFFVQQRESNGQVYPKQNLGTRPSSGSVYPRPKIYRYG